MPAAWQPAGQVRHGFTHFELTIDLFAARVAHIDAPGFAYPIAALAHEALPSLMRKCVRMAGAAQLLADSFGRDAAARCAIRADGCCGPAASIKP